MRVVILCLLFASLNSSCKKYRLNGDKEILVGDWEWVSTEVDDLYGSGSYLASPITENYTASISFAKRNKVLFSKDGTEEDSGRIKIVVFEETDHPTYSWDGAFTFRKDGERRKYHCWIVAGNDDELHLRGFPIESDNAIQVWYNVFRRK
jgi:hypothetical protein